MGHLERTVTYILRYEVLGSRVIFRFSEVVGDTVSCAWCIAFV